MWLEIYIRINRPSGPGFCAVRRNLSTLLWLTPCPYQHCFCLDPELLWSQKQSSFNERQRKKFTSGGLFKSSLSQRVPSVDRTQPWYLPLYVREKLHRRISAIPTGLTAQRNGARSYFDARIAWYNGYPQSLFASLLASRTVWQCMDHVFLIGLFQPAKSALMSVGTMWVLALFFVCILSNSSDPSCLEPLSKWRGQCFWIKSFLCPMNLMWCSFRQSTNKKINFFHHQHQHFFLFRNEFVCQSRVDPHQNTGKGILGSSNNVTSLRRGSELAESEKSLRPRGIRENKRHEF